MPPDNVVSPEPPPKAFLSHSSADAELVRSVAAVIGRPFVKLDYYEFHTGAEFLLGVERALEQTSVFVLFVSRKSLESLWVKTEIDSARYEMMFGRISKVVVCLLDDTLQVADIPAWMRRYKVVMSRAAKPIARTIRGAIDDLMRERQHSLFVNRTHESAELQEVIAPSLGAETARVFAVVGLEGIGRRTLLQRVAKDILSIPRILTIDLESGDSVNDLAVKIADLVEPASSPEEAVNLAREIEGMSISEAADRAARDLHLAIVLGELPTLIDRGGLLDNDGRIDDSTNLILKAAASVPELSIALVSARRPRFADDRPVPTVRLSELPETDVRRLVSLLARQRGLDLTPEEIVSLSSTTRGYPPSARFAVDLAVQYGVAVTSTQTKRAVEFRMRPIRTYLRTLHLSDIGRACLRVLAANSPLPLETLAQVCEVGVAELGGELLGLIDSSLVTPTNSGWYRLLDPVIDTVIREIGACTKSEFSAVAVALEDFLSTTNDELSLLELARVRYRALLQSGSDTDQRFVFALASDWVRSAKDLYHRREYERAETVARLALEARPANTEVRSYLVRSLVKQGELASAELEIRALRGQGDSQQAAFLEGFLERHRGRFADAVIAYKAAKGMGRKGVDVDRELAHCYLELGDLENAKRSLDAAISRQADNPFLIDMGIRIALYEGDETAARDLLETLSDVDDPAFHAFRKSRVELYFGEASDVLSAAKAAVNASGSRPSFEVQAQLVLALTMVGNREEAETTLAALKRMYPNRSQDVQRGLECRLQILAGRFDDALATWERLDHKGKPVHLRLRRDAIQGLLDHTNLASSRRTELKTEVSNLDASLAGVQRGRAEDLVGGLPADA